MYIKVFIITPLNKTFSGCALISANSKQLAEKLYKEQNDGLFMWKEGDCHIREFEELYYNGSPAILIDTISSN